MLRLSLSDKKAADFVSEVVNDSVSDVVLVAVTSAVSEMVLVGLMVIFAVGVRVFGGDNERDAVG